MNNLIYDEKEKIMSDFDEDKYGLKYCNEIVKCNECDCGGCVGQDAYISLQYNKILKGRLKKIKNKIESTPQSLYKKETGNYATYYDEFDGNKEKYNSEYVEWLEEKLKEFKK